MRQSPTIPPPAHDGLNQLLLRNIDALRARQQQEAADAPAQERLAATITRFTGSMRFVYVHSALYGFWIVANLGWIGLPQWDPTFVMLAMIASVEAIFLSTFILIRQSRMAADADRRAELDLQITLLTEQEVTKLVELVSEIARRVGVPETSAAQTEEMKRPIAPEAVLNEIEKTAPVI